MKTRFGFVSNSSSSSFTIPLSKLNRNQIELIVNHESIGLALGLDIEWAWPPWRIWFSNQQVVGETSMDNFDMLNYLITICGVNKKYINWMPDSGWHERDNDWLDYKKNSSLFNDEYIVETEE